MVLEGVEVLLDLLVAGLGLELDGWDSAGQGNLAALALLAGHQPLHILRLGGLDLLAIGGVEVDPRLAQADGPAAVVGDDKANGHHAVGQIVDAKDGCLLARVVGFCGDGNFFVSTAAKAVAGCTGGGVWLLATAGSASQSRIGSVIRKVFIVLDCIICG